jgi:hypothetical protein
MEPIFIAAVIAIGGTLAAGYFTVRAARKRAIAWTAAAERLGLSFVPGTWRRAAAIEGTFGALDLKLDTYTVSTGKSSATYTRLVVRGLEGHLSIGPEGALSGLKKIFTGPDHETGDVDFDKAVLIRGRRGYLTAVLDEKTRLRLRTAVGPRKMKVKDGTLEYVRSGVLVDTDQIVDLVRFALEVSERLLLAPSDEAGRIARIVREDPDSGVRERALLVLCDEIADSPERSRALAGALKDASPVVRSAAASRFGSEGIPILLSIIADKTVADEIRARSIERIVDLAGRPAQAEIESSLGGLLQEGGSVRLHQAALKAIDALSISRFERGSMALAEGDERGRLSIEQEAGAVFLIEEPKR